MKGFELHPRSISPSPKSPRSYGDELSDSACDKIQAADSADMRRMGKKQEFRVRVMC